MQYNYNNIVRKVAVNLNIDSPDSKQVSIIKNDIFDILVNAYAKAEPIKKVIEKTITQNTSKISLPETFFRCDEVVFRDSNGHTLNSKEITQEKYLRWTPMTFDVESSFTAEALNGVPESFSITKENEELDGSIGYYFSDENDMSALYFKPAVNGKVVIMYSVFPEDSINELQDIPRIHKSFISLLVAGATIKSLLRVKPTNEIDLADKNTRLRMYQSEYKESLSDFAGYINRTTSTPIVEPFNFMNFYDDNIYG